ncbi:MAG: hypothetical protein INQ03_08365 [Candidatus Heimdallarchaeota archaeon]|nr:hypothetical protein [Candidatus Heimdallarchaeota archaeon]
MTTIHISKSNWKRLNQLKEPGETMDDVVSKILSSYVDDEENTEEIQFDTLLDKIIEVQEAQDPTIEEILDQPRLSFGGATE